MASPTAYPNRDPLGDVPRDLPPRGEKSAGSPALFSLSFVIRQMSIPVIAFLVSVFVLRCAVRKRRPSVLWAVPWVT